jgi:hypothetical protein
MKATCPSTIGRLQPCCFITAMTLLHPHAAFSVLACFLKIPTSYSNSLHTRKLKDKEGRTLDEGAMREFKEFFLAHNQFGIGVPGGLEAMIHLIQLHTSRYRSKTQ